MITRSRRCADAVIGLGVLAVMLISAAPADAQIYSWRDADGTRVLSDRPPPPEADAVGAARTDDIRTSRVDTPVEAPAQYDTLIRYHALQHGLRPDLIRAVIQIESGFDPDARSPVGAMGLMQLMPRTARALGVSDPFDPNENVGGGVAYLRQLLDRYDGDETLALAAYNAGPEAVRRYGDTVPPYPETLGYLQKVGAATGRRPRERQTPTGVTIYKTSEIVDGRRVPVYTNIRPAGRVDLAASGHE